MPEDRTEKARREIARIVAGGYEDHQGVRKATLNRLRDLVRKINEGIPFDQVEEKKDERSYDQKYQDANLPVLIRQLLDEGKLTQDQYDYLANILELAMEAQKLEGSYAKAMNRFVKSEPLWEGFLRHVKGIGPTITTQIVKEFGYGERFETISKLWKISGLDVQDGKAPRRVKGEKTGFDLRKRVLAWKIGDLLIKHNSPYYRDVYDAQKAKELAREDESKPTSPLHAHRRASRKMVKLFLAHFWETGRTIKGLPIRAAYVEEKLGHTGIVSYKDVLRANGVAV